MRLGGRRRAVKNRGSQPHARAKSTESTGRRTMPDSSQKRGNALESIAADNEIRNQAAPICSSADRPPASSRHTPPHHTARMRSALGEQSRFMRREQPPSARDPTNSTTGIQAARRNVWQTPPPDTPAQVRRKPQNPSVLTSVATSRHPQSRSTEGLLQDRTFTRGRFGFSYGQIVERCFA